jgi:DNA-binding response OmpR family regulator
MSRQRLLVVDSDPVRLMLLADRLRGDGFEVTAAVTGEHVIESLEADPPDLSILGPSIAPGDDATVAGWIRNRATTPILHLRAGAVDHGRRATGVPGIADRALVAPFSHEDVLAAIDDLLARAADRRAGAASIRLDAETGLAEVAGRSVQLSPLEARLVAALLAEPGVTVSTSRLVAEIWPAERNVEASSIWILAWRVRQKIELDPKHPTLLESVPSAGYRLAVAAAPEPGDGRSRMSKGDRP